VYCIGESHLKVVALHARNPTWNAKMMSTGKRSNALDFDAEQRKNNIQRETRMEVSKETCWAISLTEPRTMANTTAPARVRIIEKSLSKSLDGLMSLVDCTHVNASTIRGFYILHHVGSGIAVQIHTRDVLYRCDRQAYPNPTVERLMMVK
jgi:hypothetical protein